MRFRVRTNEEAEDIIISYLEDIGLEGAQIEDNAPLTASDKEQMFIDAPELEPDEKETEIEAETETVDFDKENEIAILKQENEALKQAIAEMQNKDCGNGEEMQKKACGDALDDADNNR